MGFLFPAVLGGLAAVSIPIAIHLLNKFKVRLVDWAAMRFLLDSLRRNERRVKIEDLVLLAMRCLLVALLVLAFARPVLEKIGSGTAENSGPVTAVVLLDNSASMAQGNALENRFEQAKKEIGKWLDRRDAGTRASLCLVSNRVQTLIPQPTADFALFRKLLEGAKLTDRGSDLVEGIRTAYQILAETGGSDREIRVYSDDQSTAWVNLEEVRKLAAENPDVALRTVTIGPSGEENLGVIGLSPVGGVPAARQPCRMRVEVGNFGTQPAEAVRLSVMIDEMPAGESQLPAIAPGATQAVEVALNFPDPGPHLVSARIPPDALQIDNERTAAVNVIRQMNTLIVEEGDAETPIDRAGFFLANALAPLPLDKAAQHYLTTSFTSQPSAAELSESAVVFLANAGRVPAETAGMLREYVQRGGNLVIFPGPQWEENSPLLDLLPATTGPAQQTEEGKPLHWQARDFEHPVTALWNDTAQGNLGSVQVAQYFPLTPKPGKIGVVARLENGELAVAEWQFGKGNVVLFNSTATPAWNSLPLHPGFVALLQRLMGHLTRADQARLVLPPGEPFAIALPEELKGREFSVQRPGNPVPQSSGLVTWEEEKAWLRYANTEVVGGYRVFVDNRPIAAFAVSLAPWESDLRQIDSVTLKELTQPAAAAPGTERRKVVTQELWTLFIWIALALGVAEAALAHRFSYAR